MRALTQLCVRTRLRLRVCLYTTHKYAHALTGRAHAPATHTRTPEKVRANAYDLCINGVEIGGGSIRIFDRDIQMKMFGLIGLTKEEAIKQFGFLLGAFEYGAPPHGGLAFGLDR